MVIIREANLNEAEWEPCSKQEMLASINKFKTRRMYLFRVGPDDYIIERAIATNSNGILFLQDSKEGLTIGLDIEKISNQISKFIWRNNTTTFNFRMGSGEYKLTIG